MLKTRLIPVLLLQNGLLVRSQGFHLHQVIGNPINEVKRFSEWSVDELIYIDISEDDTYDLRRNDHRVSGISSALDLLEKVSETCFMPLTWGGRIRTFDDVRARISRGADKVTLNTAAWQVPELVEKAAKAYGSQAVVVNIDVRSTSDGWRVWIERGRKQLDIAPVEWARQVEDRGAGEILLQSIDRDGEATGYDVDLIAAVSSAVDIPVIALGGVGTVEHYAEGVRAGAAAVAAANLWHFQEHADRNAKRAMRRAGVDVRSS
jgi:imidazole glycerol-phosphate synthase subunit HisF